jgi:hypothetical protein
MKIRRFLVMVLASAFVIPASSPAQDARLKLDLGSLSSRAKEEVNISIDKNTLEWAIQGLKSKAEDADKLRELMKELGAITVQSLGFDEEKAPSWDELVKAAGGAMKQIDGPNWTPIVSVTGKEKDNPEFVRISLFKNSAGEMGGLAVLVVEPTEVVLVNLVGKVRLDQLALLGQILGKSGMSIPQVGKPAPQAEKESK